MSALGIIARQERRVALVEPALWIALAVFALLSAYAMLSGAQWTQTRAAEAQLASAQSAERNAGFRKDLAIYEAGQGSTLVKPSWYAAWIKAPTTPDARIAMPVLPLAAFSSNAGELQPLVANMRAAASRYSLLDDFGASTQNPASLAVGRFDMVFLLVAVLPLLILAFTYNLLSSERESGTLDLVMTQPVRLATVLIAKLLVRGVVVLVPVLALVMAGALFVGRSSNQSVGMTELFALAGLVLTYGAFWLAVAAVANAWGRSSSTNALVLGGVWLLVVMAIPSLLNVSTSAVFPPPDRAEFTNALRSTLVESRNRGENLVSDFNLQHPDRPITDSGAAHDAFDSAKATLRTWLVRERADALLQPVATRFEARLEDQQRIAERFRFLSPALSFEAALKRLAGTDTARSRAFRDASRAHLDQLRSLLIPMVLVGESLKAADIDRLPKFAMTEPRRSTALLADWLGIVVPCLVLTALAALGVRSYRKGA